MLWLSGGISLLRSGFSLILSIETLVLFLSDFALECRRNYPLVVEVKPVVGGICIRKFSFTPMLGQRA